MNSCPSHEQLRRLGSSDLNDTLYREIEAHVEHCPLCQQLLSDWQSGSLEDTPAATAPADASPSLPSIPGYELRAELGRGGMGVVYRAWQVSLQREVALKTVLGSPFAGPDERKRFRREALATAALHHPAIVEIYEVGETGGRPFFAMEMAKGRSLASRLNGTPLPPRSAARLVEILAQGVEFAHSRDIIHRDLKPSNVLLTGPATAPPEEWLPKISDFGLAKQLGEDGSTQAGAVLGTPSYMAPEQAGGVGLTGPCTDVYGLGAVLYELLTGRPPFRAASRQETLEQVRTREPVAPRQLQPGLPRDLDTICLKCLHKEPNRRYSTARELAGDLGRFRNGELILARPVGLAEKAWRWCRREPRLAALTLALSIALLGGLSTSLSLWWQAVTARQEAEDSHQATRQLLGEFVQVIRAPPLQLPGSQWTTNLEILTRAEAHYRGLLQKRETDARLRKELAETNVTLGSLHLYCGQTEEALPAYKEALKHWEQLVQQEPSNEQYRDGLARTLVGLGSAYDTSGQPLEALQLFQKAYSLWRALPEKYSASSGALEVPTVLPPQSLMPIAAYRIHFDLFLQEEIRTILSQATETEPTNLAARSQLAWAYFSLGELNDRKGLAEEARRCWQQAYGFYKKLVEDLPHNTEGRFRLTRCCLNLAQAGPADPYGAEAVRLLERLCEEQEVLVRADLVGAAHHVRLGQLYAWLSQCHGKAGRTAKAEAAFERFIQLRDELVSKQPANVQARLAWLEAVWPQVSAQMEAKRPDAALARARPATTWLAQQAHHPPTDTSVRQQLGLWALCFGVTFRKAGALAEALTLGEDSVKIFEELTRDDPEQPRHRMGLSQAWRWLANTRWELGRVEEALDAWRQAVAEQRKVFAQAPSVYEYRSDLSDRYDNLLHRLRMLERWTEAAACFLEQEKLWPDNHEKLLELSRDFEQMATAVGQGRKDLSPAEQAERQRYLEESARLAQQAQVKATKPTKP